MQQVQYSPAVITVYKESLVINSKRSKKSVQLDILNNYHPFKRKGFIENFPVLEIQAKKKKKALPNDADEKKIIYERRGNKI